MSVHFTSIKTTEQLEPRDLVRADLGGPVTPWRRVLKIAGANTAHPRGDQVHPGQACIYFDDGWTVTDLNAQWEVK